MKRISSTSAITMSTLTCNLCPSQHYINSLPKFLSGSPSRRREVIQQTQRCFNCLSRNHFVKKCGSKFSCRLCKKTHHTLLYGKSDDSSRSDVHESDSGDPVQTEPSTSAVSSACAFVETTSHPRVLLATALVTVTGRSGRSVVVRALLDPGSEMTLVSENIVQILRLRRIRMPTEISAIAGMSAGMYTHAASIVISLRNAATPVFSTTALILRTLTRYIPRLHDQSRLAHLTDLHSH